MTAPLTRTSRVVHANRLKSYGVGDLVELDGADHARVQFVDDRTPRLVLINDLSPERALPLAVRPRHRLVYPRERS